MASSIQAVRGMNDLLPGESSIWQQVEGVLRQTLASFGYSEVRMPLVEKTGLFCRAIGEVTDVVEKEMYTFEDRSGDSLSLRPEGTSVRKRADIVSSIRLAVRFLVLRARISMLRSSWWPLLFGRN